jgi:hypothetical protein
MKRILAVSLLAFAVPLVPGPPAVGQTVPGLASACPSDTPVAPPMGDVDQFVAFDSHGCPIPATVATTVAPSGGAAVTTPAGSKPAQHPASAAPAEVGSEPLPDVAVTIPVEDGFVATTGQAEADAAARPKPADYSQRLDVDYCAAVPWKCNAEAGSFND